jgi:hypothetical protein
MECCELASSESVRKGLAATDGCGQFRRDTSRRAGAIETGSEWQQWQGLEWLGEEW